MSNKDWAELEETIKETTKNLKRLKDLSKWRFQLGSPDWYEEFEKEMAEAQKGWMSSMC
jgi:hypothetical protein